MHLVLGDEVHLVKLVTGLVNAMDQRLDPDSHACKVRLLVGHRRPLALVRVQVEQFLDFLDLCIEDAVDLSSCLLLDKFNDGGAFGKDIEVLKHFYSVLDG